ncbi:MAG: peptide MFS transporter [Wenzhouxiangella sp.]|jgi:POT family proton-dependent oligopeptide transporter|nr:peptide MFS transporter [Wenzhouxiangella sp.]
MSNLQTDRDLPGAAPPPDHVPAATEFFGHPRGLHTLFFLELWERFSYYGMRAILVLFMVATLDAGGMGLPDATATAIYGLYTAGVYLLALPGGWIADRLIGQQRAVWYGGIVIAAGHFSLAVPDDRMFFLGLVLIVVGTGLLKPNVSTIVGELYPEGGSRRDAGFSIFYMGINVGAFIGPLICGYLGESVNWHYGFASAGVGMVLGLIQYRLTQRYLGQAGKDPSVDASAPGFARDQRLAWGAVWGACGAFALLVILLMAGAFVIDPVAVAGGAMAVIFGIALVYFIYILALGGLESLQKKRVLALAVLFLFSGLFWAGFEQAGSSLNLFAERYTDRDLFGWTMPASWLQSINPIFIILLAPAFAAFWVHLGRRNLDPSIPAKFALGLILLGIGFGVMALASVYAVRGDMVLPTWLVLTYLFHTMGELCLSPVGLSAVTKLSPRRFLGQMMGLWFISIALGNIFAGLVAGRFDDESLADFPMLFATTLGTTVAGGLILLALTPMMKRLIGRV